MSDKYPGLSSVRVKARIRQAALELESFTIEDLCSRIDLEPEQVYHEIAHLKRGGFLTAEGAYQPGRDDQHAPHRPKNLYRLAEDSEKRYKITEGMPLDFTWWASRASKRFPPHDELPRTLGADLELDGFINLLNRAIHPYTRDWNSSGSDPLDRILRRAASLDASSWNRIISHLTSEPGLAADKKAADSLTATFAEFRLCLEHQCYLASAVIFRTALESATCWAKNPRFVGVWLVNFLSCELAEDHYRNTPNESKSRPRPIDEPEQSAMRGLFNRAASGTKRRV